MAMTLAEDYYTGDLDDVVHRLLPREIWADVGVAVPPPSSWCAARRRGDDHAAVVEDIAAHLVGILDLDIAREHPRPHWQQHVREQRRRAGMGNGSRASVAVGGGHGQYDGGATRHAPPASRWNGAALCLPRFEMAAAMSSHPPARCHGTGVFLPRVEAYEQQNRASSTSAGPNPRNGAEPPRMERKKTPVMVAMRQQQQHQLHLRTMVAQMQWQREAFAAAFHFNGCAVIAPPQQWTYLFI